MESKSIVKQLMKPLEDYYNNRTEEQKIEDKEVSKRLSERNFKLLEILLLDKTELRVHESTC